jgi:hypothetical protein
VELGVRNEEWKTSLFSYLSKKMNLLISFIMITLLFSSCTSIPYTNENVSLSRYDLENDMFLSHEGLPAGVPDSYDWKYEPRLGYGINIPKETNNDCR